MTDRERHERASALFMEIRRRPREEQLACLDAAGADAALRREVLTLLEHDLEDTLAGVGGVGGGGGAAESPANGGPAPTGTRAGEGAGDVPARIGPYTVIGRLGRGGSGVVLLGEQHEPVRRRVAIKIVPHAAVSPEFAARFDFERRALERTDHPNIARVLDAGRTADGLPYLVMDYVEGVPITEYARRCGLGLRERIVLMLDVADAVQHAHQRGVIHRDLKPANILVGEAGGAASGGNGGGNGGVGGTARRGTPRVLDFGIAKPIPGAFGEESPPTVGLALGTPSYMAPEQTGGRPVDTRADVYALGAVLYELACGRPPLPTETAAQVDRDPVEVLRRVRDEVPPPASRIRSQQQAPSSADRVSPSLLHDLDCILAKALEKDPERRYATAFALASDLRRLLRHEPIEARPPTVRYRAARFAQRNRGLVAGLSLVALALAIGVAGLAAGLIEATRQRREAANQTEAQQQINRFLTDDLLAAASPDQEGEKVTALDLLHRASRKVDRRFTDRPLIAAAIHHALGNAYSELGAYDDAERHLDRALALRRAAAGIDAPDTVHTEIASASLLARRQRPAEAEAALTEAVRRARLILGADAPALYTAMNDLGVVYFDRDKGQAAVEMLHEALAGRARLLGPLDPQVLATTSNLALAYERTGQTERSLELLIESLRLADGLEEPPRMMVIGLCNNIGATYQDLNRDAEAAPYLRRAASLAEQWLGGEHPATLTLRGNLAALEAELGNPGRGAELYDAVVKSSTRLLGPDAQETLVARSGYWNCLWIAKRFDEAAAGYAALLADMARVLGDEHWLTVQTRASLARALKDGGRPAEALPYAERASAQFLALYGADHPRTRTTAALLESLRAAPAGVAERTPADPARERPPG